MTIEDKVFKRLRFDSERMLAYGFEAVEFEGEGCEGIRKADGRSDDIEKNGKSYSISADIMNADFTAVLRVSEDGSVSGKVWDNMNDEEFYQLRNPNYNGAYVNTVRDTYEKLLIGIAVECCEHVPFASDQGNRISDWILREYGIAPDFPWEEDQNLEYGVFRHHGSRRWFGVIMNIPKGKLDSNNDGTPVDVMNLKIEEASGRNLRKREGIYPGWHMNHRTWISVLLDDTLPDEDLRQLVRGSFKLTENRASNMDDKLVREVLDTALSIPYGMVASYGQIARIVGREKNSRMVGKIMSMADRYGEYPCHRVVNSAGRTVPGWPEQRELLEAEGIEFKSNGCVDMEKFRWNK